MVQILNEATEPAFNLAAEEYFLKYAGIDDDIIMFWRNQPTVVIGKHQNPYAELNLEYIKNQGIQVVRRLSGGGAVYHDLGNLNFTMITANTSIRKNDFSFFLKPLIEFFRAAGIPVQYGGRNDILVDGKKVSGSAQYFYHHKILHHGTLLFNSNLGIMSQALAPGNIKLSSKGISSVKSRVGMLSPFFPSGTTIEQFQESVSGIYRLTFGNNLLARHISEPEHRKIEKIAEKRYRTWEWTYGASPEMAVWNEAHFDGGVFSLYIQVEHAVIKSFQLYGDFFEIKPITELEQLFIGVPLKKDTLSAVLEHINCEDYIENFSNQELMQLVCGKNKT